VELLLHGFGSSLQTWDAWAEGLRERHRVLRLELPGQGLSDPDLGGSRSDARAHRLLDARPDARGIARATFVGHSIGRRIAWAYAARSPGRGSSPRSRIRPGSPMGSSSATTR
jgi:pimeloyl-ACP methyl ester carboxylesterase